MPQGEVPDAYGDLTVDGSGFRTWGDARTRWIPRVLREETMVAMGIRKCMALGLMVAALLSEGLLEPVCGQGTEGPSPLLGASVGAGLGSSSGTNTPQGEQEDITKMPGLPPWLTISANLDLSYRSTNFDEPDHDVTLFLGDSRLEFWIPPWDKGLAWGPYLRLAGIASNRDRAWENAWLASPGAGFQAYPFSHPWLHENGGLLQTIFGPMRLFGEWNRLDYLHEENEWRPDEQIRAGADYWRAIYVNDTTKPLWAEIWSGLFWQSANEFDDDYDTVLFANAVRAGIRKPDAGVLSMLTPYFLVESSLSDNDAYSWENKLVAGGGIRLTPLIRDATNNWLTRLVVFAEYLEVVDYYREEGPSGTPDHDFRAGISLSIGEWYRTE
jgi:hypothetical protein